MLASTHRMWVALAHGRLHDDEGHRRLVGTIRDVTAERYADQCESARRITSTGRPANPMNTSSSAHTGVTTGPGSCALTTSR